jgi:hypothetical protein
MHCAALRNQDYPVFAFWRLSHSLGVSGDARHGGIKFAPFSKDSRNGEAFSDWGNCDECGAGYFQ